MVAVLMSYVPHQGQVRTRVSHREIDHCFDSIHFFFNDTATTEIYTLSLHDALPISTKSRPTASCCMFSRRTCWKTYRSEEHTSELQSHLNLVCRLLLEKKKRCQQLQQFPPPILGDGIGALNLRFDFSVTVFDHGSMQ